MVALQEGLCEVVGALLDALPRGEGVSTAQGGHSQSKPTAIEIGTEAQTPAKPATRETGTEAQTPAKEASCHAVGTETSGMTGDQETKLAASESPSIVSQHEQPEDAAAASASAAGCEDEAWLRTIQNPEARKWWQAYIGSRSCSYNALVDALTAWMVSGVSCLLRVARGWACARQIDEQCHVTDCRVTCRRHRAPVRTSL